MSYSPYQRKVIDRFYEHADTRTLTKLQEAVSEIYLAADDMARAKLWKSVEGLLAKTIAKDAAAAKVVAARDVKGLAEIVTTLSAPGGNVHKPKGKSGG